VSIPTAPGAAPLAPPKRALGDVAFDVLLWGGLIVLLAVSFGPTETYKIPLLFTNSENMRLYGADLKHPDFTHWRVYVEAMWLTIEIALWGTFLSFFIAVPAGFLAARNIAPIWVVQPVRRVLDFLRAAPDLVIATLFVAAVGLGPFAGVMAIALNTGGVLGKLFSEAVEAMDSRPVEGVRATGAMPLHEIVWGVLPQVAPLWTSFALYRFESNARSATILGLIGAGGIGRLLFENLNGFRYQEVSTIAIVIIVAVSGIDLLSQTIRKRLI
jgi:phosphonate transport system permease protein